jgi:hypothetical protein
MGVDLEGKAGALTDALDEPIDDRIRSERTLAQCP